MCLMEEREYLDKTQWVGDVDGEIPEFELSQISHECSNTSQHKKACFLRAK